MTTPADLVRDSCAQLAGYRAALEYHLTQASSGDGGMAPRPADAPFPGDPQAFAALMVIWEKVPRLEASLKLAVAGHPGARRPSSERHFLAALGAIPGLAAGLKDKDDEEVVAQILEWLMNVARIVPAIDEAQRWRPVPQRPCPYCGCFFLKVLEDAAGQPAGRVQCFGHLPSGEPCRAAWARLLELASDLDGLVEAVPDLEE